MDAIGGYFELAEFERSNGFFHSDGILLNTGRNVLEYILRSIHNVKKIYLPYYTCDAVLEPLKKLNIPWYSYHINDNFEIIDDILPKKGEYIIANNYFGIKDAYIQLLAERYGDHLIVDCAQALFAKPLAGIKCFYSFRKFVGVADGGAGYLGDLPDGQVSVSGIEYTANHDKHLFTRKQFGAEAGFSEYQENETKLINQPIRWMSHTTKRILGNIDFDRVILRRRDNFSFLHKKLKEKNSLQIPDISTFVCPMVYPYVTNSNRNLRKELIDNKIFVAKYWPNIQQQNSFKTEYYLANNIIPIPCDQRYCEKEMDKIIAIIN